MDLNLVMPYLVAALLVALVVIGIIARRWQKGLARKLQQANADGVNFSNADNAYSSKVIQSVQTAVFLETPVEQAETLLADLKLPMFWVHPTPREWGVAAAKGDTELAVDLTGMAPGQINNAPHRWERKN